MSSTRGILILALGHPNYVKMARNLAVSLRYGDPQIKIALVTDKEVPRETLFDQYIIAPPESYQWKFNEKAYIKSKTFIYDLSPFDDTIYVDADTIWLPNHKPSEMFDKLKDVDFTMSNRGYINLKEDNEVSRIHGSQLKEVREAYGFTEGHYYVLHSEFVYFKKSEENKKYFDTVKKCYDDHRVTQPCFAGAIPDEFAFAIAGIIQKKHPHEVCFTPDYWHYHDRYRRLTKEQIFKRYYMYSLAGNRFGDFCSYEIYNDLVDFYYKEMGMENPYFAEDKKEYLTDRASI